MKLVDYGSNVVSNGSLPFISIVTYGKKLLLTRSCFLVSACKCRELKIPTCVDD